MTENIIERVIGWLRAGYPQGVPHGDYVALFGVLHRALTDTEVRVIADRLAASDLDEITHDDIADLIRETVHQNASTGDVRRVGGRLAAGGWPLASFADVPDEDSGVASAVAGTRRGDTTQQAG